METIVYIKVLILGILATIPFLKEKGLKLYHPAVLVAIVYFIEFGIPTLYMLLNPSSFWIVNAKAYDVNPKMLSKSMDFILPSIEEGLACVQAQAMACRLPVICTANTGGSDIIREGKEGFIIPIRDVSALKEKIVYLYENPEVCCAIGKAAIERVSNKFTWDDYGEKIIKRYIEILKR